MSLATALGQRVTGVEVESTDGDRVVTAVLQGLDLLTPNTTATVVFNSNGQSESVLNTSASTIASLAVTLPSVSVPGQTLQYYTHGTLQYYTHGTLTAVVVTGGTVVGPAWTSGAADSTVTYKALNATGTWVRTR